MRKQPGTSTCARCSSAPPQVATTGGARGPVVPRFEGSTCSVYVSAHRDSGCRESRKCLVSLDPRCLGHRGPRRSIKCRPRKVKTRAITSQATPFEPHRGFTGNRTLLLMKLLFCYAAAAYAAGDAGPIADINTDEAVPDLGYNDGSFVCPGSPASNGFGTASTNAWARVQVVTSVGCEQAALEINLRAQGTGFGRWTDPHNGGKYFLYNSYLDANGPSLRKVLSLTRRTGDDLFTDAITFALEETADNRCQVYGCSESQGKAMGDFSTNYCNVHNLVCGSSLGCTPISVDPFTSKEHVQLSVRASSDPAQCFNGANIAKIQQCDINIRLRGPEDAQVPEKKACLAELTKAPALVASPEASPHRLVAPVLVAAAVVLALLAVLAKASRSAGRSLV